jgi:hypothetical protein
MLLHHFQEMMNLMCLLEEIEEEVEEEEVHMKTWAEVAEEEVHLVRNIIEDVEEVVHLVKNLEAVVEEVLQMKKDTEAAAEVALKVKMVVIEAAVEVAHLGKMDKDIVVAEVVHQMRTQESLQRSTIEQEVVKQTLMMCEE